MMFKTESLIWRQLIKDLMAHRINHHGVSQVGTEPRRSDDPTFFKKMTGLEHNINVERRCVLGLDFN